MKILVIEDDKDIGELIEYNLKRESFGVEVIKNGLDGLSKARRTAYDLILLDLMLPGMGGLEICKILKSDSRLKEIPVIMLTAKGEEVDRIVGFEVGADDYLTKPFSPRELVLRIKALLRRSSEKPTQVFAKKSLHYGQIEIDPEKFQVLVGKKECRLTAIEFKLLYHLVSTKGRVATRDSLLDQVWGYESALTTRTVDTHVKRLRAKLGKAGDDLETIRGIGYRMKEKPE